MKLHERTRMVTEAHNEASLALIKHWSDDEDLSWADIVEFHAWELLGHIVEATRDGWKAEHDLLAEIWAKFGLTEGEIVGFHGQEISSAARYMVREERHPDDPEKKGDEA